VGTADDAETLSRALRQLASAAKKLVEQKKGPGAARAKLFRVDAAFVSSLEGAADALDKAAASAGARPGKQRVSQIALDRADGVNMLLLRMIIDAFENANGIDASIPRLVPISTRRLFGKGGSGKAKKGKAGGPPAAEKAGGAPKGGEAAEKKGGEAAEKGKAGEPPAAGKDAGGEGKKPAGG
jgi:hypothetical protein